MSPSPFSPQVSASQVVDGVTVHGWYGVRFAQFTERFQPAVPASGQLAVSQLHDVPIFPQLPSRLASSMGKAKANPQSEDAFFVNVWAPAQAERLPVLVFIHGGAWLTGGGAMAWYEGARLAAQGVVVVNVSYRLGALAHAQTTAIGSLPVDDLRLGLHWVVKHIAGFGGDPTRLCVAGQSAGGWYAHLLSTLPEFKGMIDRVALLSMGTRAPWTESQQQTVWHGMNQTGVDVLACSATELLRLGMQALPQHSFQLGYAPSAFLPTEGPDIPPAFLEPEWAAQHSHAQAWYIRYTADESSAFFFDRDDYKTVTQEQVDQVLQHWSLQDLPPVLKKQGKYAGAASGLSPYRQIVKASSWRQFQRFPYQYAQALSAQGKRVVFQPFTLESPLAGFYSGHCFDLPFQFGNWADWADAPMLQGLSPEAFEVESQKWQTHLVDFVRGQDND